MKPWKCNHGIAKGHRFNALRLEECRTQSLFLREMSTALITHSKLPAAEQFEHWVFDEVLPTIRRNGAYMTDDTLEQALTSPDFLIQLATKAQGRKKGSALNWKPRSSRTSQRCFSHRQSKQRTTQY